jgi:hypothetical protein
MGCDIHLHIEYRVNGKWEHYAAPHVNRWYDLFSVMAGVRGGYKPIVEPKGFPEDATMFTRWDYEEFGIDAHSASYLQNREILQLNNWLKKQSEIDGEFYNLEHTVLHTSMGGNGLCDFLEYGAEYAPEGTDAVRLVFWFDN